MLTTVTAIVMVSQSIGTVELTVVEIAAGIVECASAEKHCVTGDDARRLSREPERVNAPAAAVAQRRVSDLVPRGMSEEEQL